MSLSRILNDDPPPPLPYHHRHFRDSPDPDDRRDINRPHSPYHTPNYNPRRREWSPDDYSPSNIPPPDSLRPPSPLHPDSNSAQDDDHDVISTKKRRRADQLDTDYQPKQKKTQRRSTRKGKEARPPEPPAEPANAPVPPNDDARFDSSDLEDCRDIWLEDLNHYVQESNKRTDQVTQYFWSSVLDRNSATSINLSRHYTTKIDSIPLSPPTPPQHPINAQYDDEFESIGHPANGQQYEQRRFNAGAEDAAHALEREMLQDPPPSKLKLKSSESKKRSVPGPGSDSESGFDKSGLKSESAAAHSVKKRKLDKDGASGADTPDGQDPSPAKSATIKLKGKAKQLTREPSQDSVSVSLKSRKRAGPKKKVGLALEIENESASRPASLAGDATPSASRPTSPVPTSTTMVCELDEDLPPLRKAKKVDDSVLMKRVKSLEDAQRKVWTNIARREVAKVYKYHTLGYQARQSQSERIAKLASIQARKPFAKTPKANKDLQAKAKRLMREMQVFWRKNEKEERDVRKREQKEAMDRLKIEEEKREAARQARKLEFLISQTELYSHFVGNKLKTSELEEGQGQGDPQALPAGAHLEDAADPQALPDIDFDDEDHTNLHLHARHNAQEALSLAKQRAQQFDTQAALERKTNEALKLAKGQAHIHQPTGDGGPDSSGPQAPLVDLDSDELNFQNPTSLSGPLTIGQPKMLSAQLKEYQIKGLNWLATLYEQGINGILADEMGLGKTVQSISLLAYLAEVHDIWGPFLVVAPASTLHNWQQELTRFVPKLKSLPYWGNVKDRATLRKFWSKKEISYDQDAPFHVLITSYQLVTQDQQYFQRVKWQYMILDEAQNIKNSSSVRWKTLLGFHCRNRLLLTGTPIQNSMQELWALLHFIMPTLFDSHDEFNEWFSKDIENAAENKGSKLNEHQLRRLHMILKPFMLRRVKRNVQNELSEKIEYDISVELSARQRALYAALLANVSVQDLLEKAANIGDAESARSLMNLVMQFRKVCNHPELFERADVTAPFSFCNFGRPGPINRESDFVILPYSTRNPIEFPLPVLFYQDGGLIDVPNEKSKSPSQSSYLTKLMNIWSIDWIYDSYYGDSGSFSFLHFINLSITDAHQIHVSPLFRRQLLAAAEERQQDIRYYTEPEFAASSIVFPFQIFPTPPLPSRPLIEELPGPTEIATSRWNESCLSRESLKWYAPAAVAPAISLYCNDRTFMESQTALRDGYTESLAFYGLPRNLKESVWAVNAFHNLLPAVPVDGLVSVSPQSQLPMSNMVVPEAKRLIYDSGKLACLDGLLQKLKSEDHRVLIYFQMTRMMDLMEEYLIYRQYKYLRLDGSSKIEDRRDMVMDWQTKPDIFVFILSTRAGGLGINLTAADTVIFYDHDWNPSNDAQAMDRAHRLGQTRQVTVYRLITKGTIDERIVQLARVKKDVQDIVVGQKNFTDATKPREIVQLLLNDEQLATLDENNKLAGNGGDKSNSSKVQEPVGDLWNEEGDDFFGHATAPAATAAVDRPDDDAAQPAASNSTRGKRRKPAASGTTRRKAGPKKKAAGDSAELD